MMRPIHFPAPLCSIANTGRPASIMASARLRRIAGIRSRNVGQHILPSTTIPCGMYQ